MTRARQAMCRLCAVALLAAVTTASADTGGLFTGLYGDRRACKVGDTLHLMIVETSSASLKTSQDTKQSNSTTLGPGVGKLKFFPLLQIAGNTAASANGSSARSGTVSARMTVQIIEVTKPGNLVVEGTRTVTVGKDKEVVRVRGEVRPKDVRPSNTIYSYDLANVQVDMAGSDPRKPRHKVGIITRLLNLFF